MIVLYSNKPLDEAFMEKMGDGDEDGDGGT